MRSPSVKTLLSAFKQLTPDDARLIKKLAAEVDEPTMLEKTIDEHCPETSRYVRSMHSNPYSSQMWRVTVALHAMDKIMGTYGVEGLGEGRGPSFAPPYEYLNSGDAYSTTLIYKRATDTLSIGSWAGISERLDRGSSRYDD